MHKNLNNVTICIEVMVMDQKQRLAKILELLEEKKNYHK
ncbi:hypothetical protein BN424_397 [Carnobacterium maltaromaticum LMA28]|uniref:Uncharacterized protein n=1 Tax=Carnobacterium maltaromaticum LMA28 TaxID=1234679 RepID=K8E1V5_CARML|nr:hypothetical protein BN424_397 [Carnobacterium maltaromaticum LMA28]